MIYKLKENRVERTYLGGKNLDIMNGKANPKDSYLPEDWICSLIYANNLSDSGKSGMTMLADEDKSLLDLFKEHNFDTDSINVLVKYLDSGINLQPQLHPTGELAREYFQKPRGKDEFYYILETYADDSCIYLGFKEDADRAKITAAIADQDMDYIYSVMNRVEVKKGDCLFIPSGLIHSIGKDILMIEVMEMSDLTFRIKFEPETKEYNLIGQTPEQVVDIFLKKEATNPDDMLRRAGTISSDTIEKLTKGKFRIKKETTSEPLTCPSGACIVLTVEGEGQIAVGGEKRDYNKYDRFVSLPQEGEEVTFIPQSPTELLFVMI
ncbi:MAG: hypothetical protein PQJ59_11640 [Spirochaetales bacterium]|nr:hypothetical protein [Spirochaetales bacterium]